MSAIEGKLMDVDARLAAIRAVVDEQAEDDALWAVYPFGTQPISEAYLQQELRRLHAVIESLTPVPPPAEENRVAAE